MAAESPPAPAAAPGASEPRHGLRIFLIWLVASAIADPVIWFALGPHMPPGTLSSTAASQQTDITVMTVMCIPVVLGVLIYFGYALITWRHRAGDEEDGPPIYGNTRVSVSWIVGTAVIVLGLFAYGTVELIVPAGAGAGEGNTPVWRPSGGTPLQVQVIAQQWEFAYRYPQFGGFETTALVLPAGENVQFNVTSLDVIHSFWAIQLGVKADANPGLNNVAYTKPQRSGAFTVRCSELCGLWHGAMFDYGRVVSVPAFRAWAARTRVQLAALTRNLPPYALTYDANQVRQLGPAFHKAGLSGAGGNYYGSQYPVQP